MGLVSMKEMLEKATMQLVNSTLTTLNGQVQS